MSCTLRSAAVTRVLARLREAGRAEDEPGKRRVRAREAKLGRKIYGRERADLYGQAPIAVADEVGELLYLLAFGRRPRTIVEFGTSLGVSTLYLASAVRDTGEGVVIATEFQPEKARRAAANLAEAGVADVVDLRVGDAWRRCAISLDRSICSSSTAGTTSTSPCWRCSSRASHGARWSPPT